MQEMHVEDTELVKRIRAGKEAQEKLFTKYRRMILAWARKGVSPDRVEDLVQKVCVEVFRSLETYQDSRKLDVFIWNVYLNVRNQYLRDEVYKHKASPDDSSKDSSIPPAQFENVSNLELRQAIYAMIAQLPETCRLSFIYRELQQLSYEEISEAQHIPLGTVKSRIAECRKFFLTLASKNLAVRKYIGR